jgi:phosphoserine phosphatase
MPAALLISNPRVPAVSDAMLAAAAQALGGTARWLNPNIAGAIAFDGALPAADAALRQVVGTAPVDVAVLPELRRRRLFVADMDSTMIEEECLDELAAEFALKDRVASITERAMRGEIAFEPALRERVALLADRDAGAIDRVLARLTPMAGARTLLATLRAAGTWTALVSGGFSVFTGPVAARIGFDEHHGNTLHVADGRMLGTVAEPILGREAKLDTLLALRERLGLAAGDTMAVGDGANDLAMIGAAGLGVAFRAKPAVAAAAPVRIEHGDLTALLYLQGLSVAEFVQA